MPWHRSPVFWFGLPGLVFLVLVWISSMSSTTHLDATAFGHSVRFRNGESLVSASWYSGRHPGRGGKDWDLQLHPSEPARVQSWFPLPSYIATSTFPSHRWHYLNLSYWFLIMIYLGLWQLPWLARYHRRKRIERALTIA